jgi:hypothetical protein
VAAITAIAVVIALVVALVRNLVAKRIGHLKKPSYGHSLA